LKANKPQKKNWTSLNGKDGKPTVPEVTGLVEGDFSPKLPLPWPAWLNFFLGKFARFAEGFYIVSAKFISKISNWCKTQGFSCWLNRVLSKRPSLLCVELFMALALSVTFYLLVRPQCLPQVDGSLLPSMTFSYLSHHASPTEKDMITPAWKKRLIGPIISGWLIDMKFKGQGNIPLQGEYQNIFGFYNAGWLFLLFFILILYRKDALLLILGVFCGLMYNLTSPNENNYYPWDMPTMLFFTWAFLLYDRKKMWPIILVIVIGGLIKETVLCCALLILLGEHWGWKKKAAGFIGVLVAFFLLSKLLMIHYGIKSVMVTVSDNEKYSDIISIYGMAQNIKYFFSADIRSVYFVNVGTLLAILLIPWKSNRDIVFKLTIFLFVFGISNHGIFMEVRDWYEVLPLGLLMVSETFIETNLISPSKSVINTCRHRILIGSHGLLILTVLMLVLGIKYYGSDARVVESLQSKAQGGDARAQLQLAQHYQAGKGVPVNPTIAFKWFFKAAEQGVAEAQYQVAMSYFQGSGTTKDIVGSIPWFRKAADQGLAEAQLQLGVRYFQGEGVQKDYISSMTWFHQAAAQTNVDAQYNLGFLYENGLGVKQDLAEAAIWYQRAGERGNVLAQNSLGMICFNFRKDYAEAAQWFRKAAEHGNALAQNSLGVLYLQGLGVKPDVNEAFRWFQFAGQQGQVEAQKNCGLILMASQHYNEAAQWFHKAAEQNNAESEFNLAQFYQRGVAYPQDIAEAMLWYSRSANQGYGPAQMALGGMYYAGQGVKADLVEAYKWFKLAQLRGVGDAEKYLTNCAAAMSKEQVNAAENELKELLKQK